MNSLKRKRSNGPNTMKKQINHILINLHTFEIKKISRSSSTHNRYALNLSWLHRLHSISTRLISIKADKVSNGQKGLVRRVYITSTRRFTQQRVRRKSSKECAKHMKKTGSLLWITIRMKASVSMQIVSYTSMRKICKIWTLKVFCLARQFKDRTKKWSSK